METRKETVIKAINFERPDHLPIWFFNRDELSGDILRFNLAIEENGKSEWGYEWEKLDDGTMMSMPYDDMFPFLDREEYESTKKMALECKN